jgi:radical SAM superfamily enzyme YgiQ (UPF0313 family)
MTNVLRNVDHDATGNAPAVLFIGLPGYQSYYDALAHPQYIGYRYLMAVVRRAGYDASIVNVFLNDFDLETIAFSTDATEVRRKLAALITRRTLDLLKGHDVDHCIIGLNVSFDQAPLAVGVAKAIKQNFPRTTILCGGVHATLCAQDLLAKCPEIDHVLFGETEASILSYLAAFGRQSLSGVRGLGWRGVDGLVILNPPAEIERDLDRLPLPAEDEISAVYRRNNQYHRLSSSRGCHGQCVFCSLHAFGRICGAPKLRFRSPVSVVDEMEHLNRAYNIKRFVFVDPEFIGPGQQSRDRIRCFARELSSRELGVSFKIDCRVDSIAQEMLEDLKCAGLSHVELGVESFEDEILHQLRKGATKQQCMKAIRCLREVGVDISLDYIFYTPWTTLAMIRRQLVMLKMAASSPHIHIDPLFRRLCYIPGTELAKQAKLAGWPYGLDSGTDYQLADPVANRICHTHMEFCGRSYAMDLNTPRIERDTQDRRVTRAYAYMRRTLSVLEIRFLDALQEDDQNAMTECEKTLDRLRDGFMRLYEAVRKCDETAIAGVLATL